MSDADEIHELPDDDDELEPLPSDQPTVDAASVRTLRKRITKRELRQRESDGFWRLVLGSTVGRRELWGLLAAAHTFDTVFACGPTGFPQSEATWFKAGEQQFGLRLYQSWLRLSPELVALMHAENDVRFAQPKSKREE